jgi:hypothetical protein
VYKGVDCAVCRRVQPDSARVYHHCPPESAELCIEHDSWKPTQELLDNTGLSRCQGLAVILFAKSNSRILIGRRAFNIRYVPR